MKFEEIVVDRFGVWRDLVLRLPSDRVNVLYGPNEAGKSTLLRFLRGVLYGFRPSDGLQGTRSVNELDAAGALILRREGHRYEIHRRCNPGFGETATVTSEGELLEFEPTLERLLGGVNRQSFESVFAVGLREMQESSSLQGAELSDHLYGAALGPDGRWLLRTVEQLQESQAGLTGSEGGSRLQRLLAGHDEVSERIAGHRAECERHAQLSRSRRHQEEEIARIRRQRADLERDVRGCRFLLTVHEPWALVRDYRRELASLPEVREFPADGMQRLEAIEGELETARRCHNALQSEVQELRRQRKDLRRRTGVRRSPASVRLLVGQRDWVEELQQRVAEGERESAERHARLRERTSELGEEWSPERLDGVDFSPEAHEEFSRVAKAYRSALVRRARIRRMRKRLSKTVRRRQTKLHEKSQALGGLSVEKAMERQRGRMVELERLGEWRLREAALEQRLRGLQDQSHLVEEQTAIPRWVYGVLGFFGVAGVVFALLGLFTGVTTSGLVGAIYALLGITCGGLAWALKSHLDGTSRSASERLADERRACEVELREVREEIARLTGTSTTSVDEAVPAASGPEADLITEAARELAELQQLSQSVQCVLSLRRRQTELRMRFQRAQAELSQARREWLQALQRIGLPESVKLDETLELWRALVGVREEYAAARAVRESLRGDRRMLAWFRERIESVARKVDGEQADCRDLTAVLDDWAPRLERVRADRTRARKLRADVRRRRREAAAYRKRIAELESQLSQLLHAGGASSREEFEFRCEAASRRGELEELLAIAESDLDAAASGQPDLAIVEEDLEDFDAEEARESIEYGELQLEELDRELQEANERLGRTKQELEALESDRTATTLKHERERLETRIRETLAESLALDLGRGLLDHARGEFERHNQSPTLAEASRLLSTLTRGRHGHVWAPLGRQELLVAEGERDLRVDQLSRGTREQLFLALRLALLRRFAERGVRVPLVLDDVLVNFDESRTEAAADAMLDFAAEGHQVLLFTCHLHLVHLLESRGVEPVWLPSHEPASPERRAG